jgi:hypothetical protein
VAPEGSVQCGGPNQKKWCLPRPRMRMLDGFNEGWIERNDGSLDGGAGHTNEIPSVDPLVQVD